MSIDPRTHAGLDMAAYDEPDAIDAPTASGFGWGAILLAFIVGALVALALYTGFTHHG